MRLEFLGVGNAFNPILGNCSVLIDNRVLIDCGSTIPLELIKRQKVQTIEDIIITHLHSDHVGGLEVLGQMLFFKYKKRVRLWVTDTMAKDLWRTLRSGMECLNTSIGSPCKAALDTYFDISYCPTKITTTNTQNECYQINTESCSFILERTEHVPDMESYSLVTDNGMLYTSDIKHSIYGNNYFIEGFGDVKAIFHDVQFSGRSENQVHAYIKDVIDSIPVEYRAITWFMHYDGDYKIWEPSILAQGFGGFVRKGIFNV